jgi:hypothetical protein
VGGRPQKLTNYVSKRSAASQRIPAGSTIVYGIPLDMQPVVIDIDARQSIVTELSIWVVVTNLHSPREVQCEWNAAVEEDVVVEEIVVAHTDADGLHALGGVLGGCNP